MKERRFKKNWDASQKMISMLLVSTLVLAATLVILASKVATQHERVVLVPPHLDERMNVGWEQANKEYYKAWAMYVSMMIGNITPDNVDFITNNLSSMFNPKIYQSLKQQLLSLAKEPMFASGTSISYFTADQVIYEPATNKVFVVGEYISTTATAASMLDSTRYVIMEFKISMQSGRPVINYFTSYPGRQPHTLKWKAANKNAAKEIDETEASIEQAVKSGGDKSTTYH
ncbi:TraE/TraK family type IV conjugative transfer system protein [Thiolapillus sp.]|uniref:TraE/TraK family type IV conjugative transfer system protein n=1 Tax=Thiolapillus sp. TaxID=2017437 RepID=UPI0025FCD8F6|nr:TraE/TraK family type IV conjugative transfer system protein [Thiolapillus sp.]